MKKFLLFIFLLITLPILSQDTLVNHFQFRSYSQFRYNLFETNPLLQCEQCDKNWREGGGLSARRVRFISFGNITPRIYYYIQPDFAGFINNDGDWISLRDAYLDLSIDIDNRFRFRLGQSKVPFGFENMQSSQNRLPLDRSDALNSALRNERDLGIFFYWTTVKIQKLYKQLVKQGLKHSGNYGMLGIGVFNGQTANIAEQNSNKHVVVRVTYPIQINNQIIETGLQTYSGRYIVLNYSEGVKINTNSEYIDQRIAASVVLYPKPFGIQAEYNIGRGPEFNQPTQSIEVQNLHGGYITMSYFTKIKNQIVIPFVRLQHYDGGKKHERDARSYTVKEGEFGIEYQPYSFFEMVAMYTFSNRRFEDFNLQRNHQTGSLMRIQAQFNFELSKNKKIKNL
jgi:hypothetical protein